MIEISLWLLMVVTPVHYQLFQESLRIGAWTTAIHMLYNEATLVTSSGSTVKLI